MRFIYIPPPPDQVATILRAILRDIPAEGQSSQTPRHLVRIPARRVLAGVTDADQLYAFQAWLYERWQALDGREGVVYEEVGVEVTCRLDEIEKGG